MTAPTLPATLTVNVLGDDLTMSAKPTKKGGIFYKGSRLYELELADVEKVKAVLTAVTASYEGVALKAGEVHLSAPRKYQAGHDKAGQVVPGSGNKWTTTHSTVIDLVDSDGTSHTFTLMASTTYLAVPRRANDKVGFFIVIQAIPQAQRTPSLQGGEGLGEMFAALAGV